MDKIKILEESYVIKIHDFLNGFDCGFNEKYLPNFISELEKISTMRGRDYHTSRFEIPTYYGNWVRLDRIDKIIHELNKKFNPITTDKLKGLTRNEIIKQIECLDIHYLNRLASGS